MSTLNEALRLFEATEANLTKLENLWGEVRGLLGNAITFDHPPGYDQACLAFRAVLEEMPAIDGFRLDDKLPDFGSVAQMRLDAQDLGDPASQGAVEAHVDEQATLLREYRFRLQVKRRALVRDRMQQLIDTLDVAVNEAARAVASMPSNADVPEKHLERMRTLVTEMHTLAGSGSRPSRWEDLRRHLHFGMAQDILDVQRIDWPAVKEGQLKGLYADHDPIPVGVQDLGEVVASKPRGGVATKLNWGALSAEDFERLMFVLLTEIPGYDNVEWLQHTNAPDKGRDLSAVQVEHDTFSGTRRYRVIVQCKHWLTKSVGDAEVSTARDQMAHWEPPRVDRLVIATSGRFTVDAVDLIERHNRSDRALHIDMWPESTLERVLAPRPHLIAQFRLR